MSFDKSALLVRIATTVAVTAIFHFVQDLENRSLVKYLLIIEEFGGWCLFQQLLEALRKIANQHGSVPAPDGKDERQPVSVAMVAISYVLGQDQVTSVILGAHGNR